MKKVLQYVKKYKKGDKIPSKNPFDYPDDDSKSEAVFGQDTVVGLEEGGNQNIVIAGDKNGEYLIEAKNQSDVPSWLHQNGLLIWGGEYEVV